jgi:alpha-beta hydrolase superfamily lysophospholipase
VGSGPGFHGRSHRGSALKKTRFITLALIAGFLLSSCATFGLYPADPKAERREGLRQEAGPLESEAYLESSGRAERTDGPLIAEYRKRLAAMEKGYAFSGRISFGTVAWKRGTLGVLLAEPSDGVEPRGAIVAYHGYLSYSSFNMPALCRLAEDGWVILAADLPGHGFSDGRNGYIGSFSHYAEVTDSLLTWLEDREARYPGPRVVLGHSGGSAAALESILQGRKVDAGILLAPLVRPLDFSRVRLGATLMAPFVSAVPPDGAEEAFLGASFLPLSWVRKLGRWSDHLARRVPMLGFPLLAIWGTKDKVLDMAAADKALVRLFPELSLGIIEGGGHIIFDGAGTQEHALRYIRDFLDHTFPL